MMLRKHLREETVFSFTWRVDRGTATVASQSQGVQHKMEGCAEARKNIPPIGVFRKPTEDKGHVSDFFLLDSY